MITNINEFKNSINESIDNANVGDMVYVNPFGPMTFKYNEMESDKAFAPKIHNVNIDTLYEIIYLQKDTVGIFDDSNEYIEININNISKTSFTNPNINESNINEAKTEDHFIVLIGDDIAFETSNVKDAKDKFKSYPKPTRPSESVSLYKLVSENKYTRD